MNKWREFSYNLYAPKTQRTRLLFENDKDIEWLEEYRFDYDEEEESEAS